MVLTIHDPEGLGLRRGIRAAVALPVGLAIALFVADDATGAIFTVFGTIGLLINADFAGSGMQRLGSYLATGLAGTVALVLGWAVSPTTVMAVALTVVVAFALSFANLLRGPIAVGTPAVLLIFVVAVSVVGTPTNLRSYLLGWWLAVVVCTVTALVLLPRNHRQDFRATSPTCSPRQGGRSRRGRRAPARIAPRRPTRRSQPRCRTSTIAMAASPSARWA